MSRPPCPRLARGARGRSRPRGHRRRGTVSAPARSAHLARPGTRKRASRSPSVNRSIACSSAADRRARRDTKNSLRAGPYPTHSSHRGVRALRGAEAAAAHRQASESARGARAPRPRPASWPTGSLHRPANGDEAHQLGDPENEAAHLGVDAKPGVERQVDWDRSEPLTAAHTVGTVRVVRPAGNAETGEEVDAVDGSHAAVNRNAVFGAELGGIVSVPILDDARVEVVWRLTAVEVEIEHAVREQGGEVADGKSLQERRRSKHPSG